MEKQTRTMRHGRSSFRSALALKDRYGRVLWDVAGSAAGVVASTVNTIVVFVIAARALGPLSFGEFAFYFAIASGFGLVFDYGYPVSLLRNKRSAIPRERLKLPVSALHTKFLLFLGVSPLALVSLHMAGASFTLGLVFWGAIALRSVGNFLATSLRGIGHHKIDAWNNLAASALGVLFAAAAYFYAPGQLGFALAMLVGAVTVFALTWYAWSKRCRFVGKRLKWTKIKLEVSENFVYFIDAVCRRSFGLLDVAILGLFASPIAVGLYQSGQKVVQGVNIFAQPFNNVLLPILSRTARDFGSFERKSRLAIAAQTVFGLLSAIIIVIAGPFVLRTLFSNAFSEADYLFPYFGAVVFSRFLFSAFVISRTAQGYIGERLRANVIVLAAFALTGPFAAYSFEARGVLITLTASSLIGLAYLLYATRTRTNAR